MKKVIWLILLITITTGNVFAVVQLGITTRLAISQVDDGATLGQVDNTTDFDNRFYLGYSFGTKDSEFHVGGTYLYESITTKRDDRADNTTGVVRTKNKYSGLGVTIGGSMKGWQLDFTYYLSPTFENDKTPKQGSLDTYSGGKGTEFGIGYNFAISPNFMIGPKYLYRTLSWDKMDSLDTGVTTSTTFPKRYSETEGRFYLNLEFLF